MTITTAQIRDLIDRLAAEALAWLQETEPPEAPAASGVGAAHWLPGTLPGGVTWGYETSMGRGVFWREIEAVQGAYNFTLLRQFLQQYTGVRVWPSIMTVDCDLNGLSKAPAWMLQQVPWIKGSCTKSGIFAPWEQIYQARLADLLRAFEQWVSALELRPAGIVCMSGGVYGETQLWSCGMEDALMTKYSLTRADCRNRYAEATKQILDLYFDCQSLPIMVQLGWPYTDQALIDYAHVRDNGSGRVYVKWNGLDPTNVGDGKDEVRVTNNSFYRDLFKQYPDLRCGFEFGHPNLLTTPERYQNVADWALSAGASFLAAQGGTTLDALCAWGGFGQLNAALVANGQ